MIRKLHPATALAAVSGAAVALSLAVVPDADAAAGVWLRSFDAALPTVRRPAPTRRCGGTSTRW